MTPKDALNQHVSKDLTDRWGEPVIDGVLAAITTYHEQQVNSVDSANIVQQRELLIAFYKLIDPLRVLQDRKGVEGVVDAYLSNL